MDIKNWLKTKILGYRATSTTYIEYLRKCGVKVGKGVKIYRPFNTTIDVQAPHLLSIGDYVQMTGPVTILNHDYSWSVLKRKYGDIYGSQRKTVIGNNVFIGWGATILGGSTIGDNVIIGANSVVSGQIESNSVYAGNPARKLMTLENFRRKREQKQLQEAKDFVLEYKSRFKRYPEESEMDEYFFLFNTEVLPDSFKHQLKLMGNYKDSLKKLKTKDFKFSSFDDFINYCKKD